MSRRAIVDVGFGLLIKVVPHVLKAKQPAVIRVVVVVVRNGLLVGWQRFLIVL